MQSWSLAEVMSTSAQGVQMTLESRQRIDDFLYHLSIGRATWLLREGHYIPLTSAQQMFCQFVLPTYLYYAVPEFNRVLEVYGLEAADIISVE